MNYFQLKCCGVDGFEDWEQSQWRKDYPVQYFNNLVPTTCCKTWSHTCGRWDIPNNIYYDVSRINLDEKSNHFLFIMKYFNIVKMCTNCGADL